MARQPVPILDYALKIEDREFLLVIHADGHSQWDDHSERLRIRHPEDRLLELAACTGNARALRRLRHERMEFTIDAPVTEEILLRAAEMALNEKRSDPYVLRSMRRHVADMDALLTEFFWKAINPLLGRPINSEQL